MTVPQDSPTHSLTTRPRGAAAANVLAVASSAAAVGVLVLTHWTADFEPGLGMRLLLAGAAAGFVSELAIRWWGRRWRAAFLRTEITEVVPAACLPVALVAVLLASPASAPGVVEAYLLAALLAQVVRLYRAAHSTRLRPAHLLVLSWAGAIAIGTGLLTMPKATADGKGASASTALFTATSAVCVTGLIVEDTGSYWSGHGQMVILVLIQLGGVGLMTFAAFIAMLLFRGLGLRERLVLRDVLSEELAHRTGRLVAAIFGVTICFEAIGGALLYTMWDPARFSPGERVYYSAFHAISAFCNAGFCLFSDSFTRYADRWQVTVVIAGLIVIGGLGFSVLVNVWQVVSRRVRLRVTGGEGVRPRFSLQTRLVLATTVVLLLVGAGLFLLLDREDTLAGQSAGGALRRAVFQSVTARTAGFNTVHIGSASLPAICLLMAWMFIGASPGSTGGGIKTVTVAILLSNLWAMLRRRTRVEAMRRTITEETVRRALAVVSMAALIMSLLILLLAVTERGRGFAFEDICFEAFSAFGTVGLSRGITPGLSGWGRIVIVFGMFIGRIGPLTLALAVYGQQRPARYEYPAETVMIG